MNPHEIELTDVFIACWVACVRGIEQPILQIGRSTFDLQFPTDISASAGAGHGIENPFRLKIQQEILDQYAGAISRIRSAAIRTAECLMIEARQPRHGAAIDWSSRQDRDGR